MATITSLGIGSGLDLQNLLQQLVAAERRPADLRITRLEARAQSQLSAFGSLKSALSAFNDQLEKMNTLDALLTRKASSADETVLTVTVSSSALPASYAVEVLQIAQAHKLQSGAFTDATTVVGTGTLSIAVGADSFDLTIDATNNTLAGIRDAINDALDNAGVSASIVTGDAGSYLTLTSANTGVSNAMVITQSGGDGGLSVLEFDPAGAQALTELTVALDSQIQIDGLAVTNDSNTITAAIAGVTLELIAAEVGVTTQITVENDKAAVVAQIDAFINSYNELIDTFDTLTKFDSDAETATPLFGDSIVRNARAQLRHEMSIAVTDISATFNSLVDIGIDFEVDGKLTLDSTKLDGFLTTEFSKIGQLFANSDGFAIRLGTVVDAYLDDDDDGGIIAARTDGLDVSIADLVKQREALDARMELFEARLARRFLALDILVGQLTSTSNFLTKQLQNLPGVQFINT